MESEQQAIACTSATCCWPWACAGEAALVIPSAGKVLRVLPTGPCSKSQIHRCPWLAAGSTSSPASLVQCQHDQGRAQLHRLCHGRQSRLPVTLLRHLQAWASCHTEMRNEAFCCKSQDMTLHQWCLQTKSGLHIDGQNKNNVGCAQTCLACKETEPYLDGQDRALTISSTAPNQLRQREQLDLFQG